MCPGMRPATGWMAYFIVTPAFFKEVGHFAEGMLRLRHRHAVARHDDDRGRVLHDIGGVVGGAGLDRALLLGSRNGCAALGAETAEDDVDDRAVHALAHDVGQDRA